MIRRRVHLLSLVAVTLAAAPLCAQSTAEIEYRACMEALARCQGGDEELARMKQRAGQLRANQKLADQTFERLVKPAMKAPALGERQFDFFADSNARAVEEVFEQLGRPLDHARLLQLLPGPGGNDDCDYGRLQRPEFVAFVRKHGHSTVDDRLASLADAAGVKDDPYRKVAVLWLGTVAAKEPPRFNGLLADYLKGAALTEELIGSLHDRLAGPGVPGSDRLRALLAEALYRIPVGEGAGLPREKYLEIAGQLPGTGELWPRWTKKMLGQLQQANRRPFRAVSILDALVSREGDHPGAMLEATKDNLDLFVFLHGEADAAPWKTLLRAQPRAIEPSRKRAGQLLLDAREKSAQLTKLLDLFCDTDVYWPVEQPAESEAISGVLRPIARDARHPARPDLLKRVMQNQLPLEWGARWDLAWEGAGRDKLLDPIGDATPLEVLARTCTGVPLLPGRNEGIQRASQTYGKLLAHVAGRLFVPAGSESKPDASFDDEVVIKQLCDVFAALGDQNWKTSSVEGVRTFWEQALARFDEAALAKDSAKMTAMLRLVLRIAVVLKDEEQIEVVAGICRKVFGLDGRDRLRLLKEDELRRQAALLHEITSAVATILNAMEPAQSAKLLPAIEAELAMPLLNTDRFPAAAIDGKRNPWIELIDLHPRGPEREAACRRLLARLKALPYLNSHGAMLRLVSQCFERLGIRPWLSPQSVEICANVNYPLVFDLLQEQAADLRLPESKAQQVVDLFLAGLEERGQPEKWTVSCGYEAGNPPLATDVKRMQAAVLYPWLARLTSFCELRDAPLTTGGGLPLDPRTVLDVKSDGQFVLPAPTPDPLDAQREARWRRGAVPGLRRYRLARAMLDPRREHGPEGAIEAVEIARFVSYLPNRPGQIDKEDARQLAALIPPGDADDRDESKRALGVYAKQRIEVANELAALAAKEADFRQLHRLLQGMLWLRFSLEGFREDPHTPAKSGAPSQSLANAIAAGRRRLEGMGRDGLECSRTLAYEEYFLRIANPSDGQAPFSAAEQVRGLLDLLASEMNIGSEQAMDDPVGAVLQWLDRGNRRAALFQSVGPLDVIAFAPLLTESLPQADLDPELRFRIVSLLAMRLPWYAAGAREFCDGSARGSSMDRIVLFGLLSDLGKDRLIELLGEDRPQDRGKSKGLGRAARNRLALLLLTHNAMAVELSATVFNDPAMLKETLKPTKYETTTIDFSVLGQVRRAPRPLNGQELLAQTIGGVSANLKLLMARSELTDARAIEHLFGGSAEELASRPSVDSVLRRCVQISRSTRYERSPDEKLRDAAAAFQREAGKVVQHPPSLPWFSGEGEAFKQPRTYFICLERAAQSIERPPPEPGAGQDLASLWRGMLLPDPGKPAWRRGFARSVAQQGTGEESSQIAAQRNALKELVIGDKPDTEPAELRLRGLRRLLRPVDDPALREYLKACETAVSSLFAAALLGEGLGADSVFPAKQFLESPGGAARPLSPGELAKDPAQRAAVCDALEWIDRWDRDYAEPAIRRLLGDRIDGLGRSRPGLGARGLDPEEPVPSFRAAAWCAFSRHAARALRPHLARVDGWNQRFHLASAEPESAMPPEARSQCIDDLMRIIAFRLEHNAQLAELRGKLNRPARVNDSSKKEISAGAWDWLAADAGTAVWARDCAWRASRAGAAAPSSRPSTGPVEDAGAWAHVRPIWAPFAAYAGLSDADRVPEPAALGIGSSWMETEPSPVRLFAMLELLDLVEVAGKEIRLRPDVVRQFESQLSGRPASLGELRGDPRRCVAAMNDWASLPTWIRLSEAGKETVELAPSYRVERIPPSALKEAAFGPLSTAMMDRARWDPGLAGQALADRYNDKAQLLKQLARRQHGNAGRAVRPGAHALSARPALDAVVEVVAKCPPLASPFQARPVGLRGVELGGGSTHWLPEDFRRMDRGRAIELLSEMCLLQRVIGPDGKESYNLSGHMEYVDLLNELRGFDDAANGKGGANGD